MAHEKILLLESVRQTHNSVKQTSGSENHRDAASRSASACGADNDLHITAKARQTVEHLRFADTCKLAAKHFR